MKIAIKDKKIFLSWILGNVRFSRREVYWILNYMLKHETILELVHFVERADACPRGITFREQNSDGDPLELTIEQHSFTDPEQIFHDIRLNWQKELFVTCIFKNSWSNSAYLTVLEDNPYRSWNSQIDESILLQLDLFFQEEEQKAEEQRIYALIDQAIEENDVSEFQQLAIKLNELQKGDSSVEDYSKDSKR